MQKTPFQKFKIFFACYTRRVAVIFITLLCYSTFFALYSCVGWHGFLWSLAYLVDWYLLAVTMLAPAVYRDCIRQDYKLMDTKENPWNWSFQFSMELRVILVLLVVYELTPWSTPIVVLDVLSTSYKRWFCFVAFPNIFFLAAGAVTVYRALARFSLTRDTGQAAVKKLASPIRSICFTLFLVIFFWIGGLFVGAFNTHILGQAAGIPWWQAEIRAGESCGHLTEPAVRMLCDRVVQIFTTLQFILIFEAVHAWWRWVRLHYRICNGGRPTTVNVQHVVAEFLSIKLILITLLALFLGCVWTDVWVWAHILLWAPLRPLPPL